MKSGLSLRDVVGLQEEICEECNGTGMRLSLDLEDEFVPCEWCDGQGMVVLDKSRSSEGE